MIAASMALGLAGFPACTTTDQYVPPPAMSPTGAATGTGLPSQARFAGRPPPLARLAGGDDRRNALIGLVLAALAGAAVGNYMDTSGARVLAERLRGLRRHGAPVRARISTWSCRAM